MRPPERRPAAPPLSAFSLALRVYYQDTDAGGVVFHAAYLHYFERARTEWLRRLGFDIARLVRQERLMFIVRSIRVAYARPALLDDMLDVTVGLEHLGRAQFTLFQQVRRDDEALVEASVNLACVTSDTLRPLRVPDALRATLAAAYPDKAPSPA